MTSISKVIYREEFGDIELTQIQRDILSYLDGHGATQRTPIWKDLQRKRTTVFDNLVKLQKYGLVD